MRALMKESTVALPRKVGNGYQRIGTDGCLSQL
jgi:hypothetical protein